MRAMIVDDEAPARQRLRQLLEELPGCEVCAEAAKRGLKAPQTDGSQPQEE